MVTINTASALRAIAHGAIGVAAVLGTAAFAQPESQIDVSANTDHGQQTRMLAVRISDLNLANPRGRTRLDSRLKVASKRVCDGWGATWINAPADYKRCYGDALDGARSQVSQRLASGDMTDIKVASR